jgi:copper chaperone NosL
MKKSAFMLFASLVFISCVSGEPKPLQLNSDACDFCKMSISNGQFGAELVTQKGRYYKFDDVACMIHFAKSNTMVPYKAFFVCDYLIDNTLVPVEKCYFLKGGTIKSPMNGNAIAFSSKKEAQRYQSKFNATLLSWKELYSSY